MQIDDLKQVYTTIQYTAAYDYEDLLSKFRTFCTEHKVAKTFSVKVEEEMEKTLVLDSDGCYAESNFPSRFDWWTDEEMAGLDPVAAHENSEVAARYKQEFFRFLDNKNAALAAELSKFKSKVQLHQNINIKAPNGASARQSGARKPARRAQKKSASSDDGGGDGDGEPPRRQPQQLYSYDSFARLLDCAEKTIRNAVSAGRFPRPLQTIFGPRFTAEHLDFALNFQKSAPASTPRPRGRPRIAQSLGKGGAA